MPLIHHGIAEKGSFLYEVLLLLDIGLCLDNAKYEAIVKEETEALAKRYAMNMYGCWDKM